jgi:RNA polymerase sigma factor (sigma-70 family)
MADRGLETVIQFLHRLTAPWAVVGSTDGELLQRFTSSREEAAFAALVQRHGQLVLGVCRRLLYQEQDAEDAFQATFLVLARKAHSIRCPQSLASWLYRVAHRLALQSRAGAARRQKQERPLNDMPTPALTDEVARQELRDVLDEALLALPEKYRLPIILCHLQGKTLAEAAQLLHWPLGTVAARLARARDQLRRRLTRRGVNLAAGALALALSKAAASAAVPPLLASATVKAAVGFAAGGTALSAPIILAQGVLRGLLVAKLKVGASLILGVALLTAGAGSWVYWPAGEGPGETGVPKETLVGLAVPEKEKPQEPRRERTDLYGDLLPEGAVARLGSIRLRHAGLSDFILLNGGKTILSAGSDRVLRFWDIASGRQVRSVRLQGTAGPRRCVTLSPDGKTLVAQDGGSLVFWEVESGKELKSNSGPRGNPAFMCFSPDGKILAVGRNDRQVSFWDWATGKEREISLPAIPNLRIGSPDSTFHGSFSPNGKWFVAGAGPLKRTHRQKSGAAWNCSCPNPRISFPRLRFFAV